MPSYFRETLSQIEELVQSVPLRKLRKIEENSGEVKSNLLRNPF
jgi:hypothetical protein